MQRKLKGIKIKQFSDEIKMAPPFKKKKKKTDPTNNKYLFFLKTQRFYLVREKPFDC